MRSIFLVFLAACSHHPANALSCYVCRHGTDDYEGSSDPGCGRNKVDDQYLQRNIDRWNDLRTLEDRYTSELLSKSVLAAGQGVEAEESNANGLFATDTLQKQRQTHENIVTAVSTNSSTGSLIHYACSKLQVRIQSPTRNGTLILRSGVWTFQRETVNTCSETNAKILIATNPSLLALKPFIRDQSACFCDVNACNSCGGISVYKSLVIIFALFGGIYQLLFV